MQFDNDNNYKNIADIIVGTFIFIIFSIIHGILLIRMINKAKPSWYPKKINVSAHHTNGYYHVFDSMMAIVLALQFTCHLSV